MAEIAARIKPPKRSRKKKYRDRKKAKKAATLTVTDVTEAYGGATPAFSIFGGSEPRTVRMKENGRWDCSCGNASSPCSHVLGVQLFIRRRDAGNGKDKRRA